MAVKRALLTLAGLSLAAGLAVAGCGSTDGSSGILRGTYSSFPDSLDPALSVTSEGWTAMQNTYLPLLTYAHANGAAGTKLIPALARSLPKITRGGRRYTLFLRPGLEYSDGSPVRASDFAFVVERLFRASSPGSPFYTDIVGAERFAKTGKGGIAGIHADDGTGRIVIDLKEPRGTFSNELGLLYVALLPRGTPDSDQTANPPPATGPYEIVDTEPGRGWDYDAQPGLGLDQLEGDAGSAQRPRRRDSNQDRLQPRHPGERHRDGQGRLDEGAAPAGPDRRNRKEVRGDAVPLRTDDQQLLLLDEHPEAAVRRPPRAPRRQLRDRPGGARTDLLRDLAGDPADPAAGDARLPEVRALPPRPRKGEGADRAGRSNRSQRDRLDRQLLAERRSGGVLRKRAPQARLSHHAEGGRRRRLLRRDRQRLDPRPRHGLVELAARLPPSRTTTSSPSSRAKASSPKTTPTGPSSTIPASTRKSPGSAANSSARGRSANTPSSIAK